jgi:glycine/D-amino acid oxidase-like deaminating enzyme
MTRLAKYSADLYVKLEEETGVATGMRQVRLDHRGADRGPARGDSCARHAGARLRRRRPGDRADEVKAMYPHLKVGDVTGAVHLPLDGQCDPPTSPWRWPRAHG